MRRRHFLAAFGGAAVIALSGGAYLSTRDIKAAQRPWQSAGIAYDEPRLAALSYAILAPSPHNQQPWKIELRGADEIVIHPDTGRFLPETDPPNRQVTIGFGAFIELLVQAATATGHLATVSLFPDGVDQQALDSRAIASVRLTRTDSPSDPLFETIKQRRTNRQPFDMERAVEQDIVSDIARTAGIGSNFGWAGDRERVSAIASIAKAAWQIEMATERTHAESTRLTRIGAAEVNRQPDGISLSGAMVEGASAVGAFSRDKLAETGSFAYDQTLSFYSGLLDETPAFAWLASPDNLRTTQITTGRQWVRLNQAANAAGLAFHPVSQALQEFPEMEEPYAELHRLIGAKPPARIQGLFRLGYAKAPPPSPRWPLSSKLMQNG